MDSTQLNAVLEQGNAHYLQGEFSQAEQCYQTVLSYLPQHLGALNNIGAVFFRQRRFEEAESVYRSVVQLDPGNAPAYSNLGYTLLEMQRFRESEAACRKAVELNPELPDAHNNLGFALYHQLRMQEAQSHYVKAIALKPNDAGFYNNMGILLRDIDELESAEYHLRKALSIDPNMVLARFNLGYLQMTQGNFEEGWIKLESRLHMEKFKPRYVPQLPAWRGEAVPSGLGIIVYPEQGLGDVLHFCRFLPLLKQRFAKVCFPVQWPLLTLLQNSFPDIEIIDGERDLRWLTDRTNYHLTCPIMSLALFLGIDSEEKIAQQKFYLKPLPHALHKALPPALNKALEPIDQKEEAQQNIQKNSQHNAQKNAQHRNASAISTLSALPKLHNKLRIGFTLSGRPDAEYACRRDIAWEAFLPVLQKHLDCEWTSFNIAPCQTMPKEIAQALIVHDIKAPSLEIRDFSDTAECLESIDLVITVETAIAHLAAAMGKPVWLMHRMGGDWRWLHGRTDSPWYPSMKIFTQKKFNVWTEVIDDISEALTLYKQEALRSDSQHSL